MPVPLYFDVHVDKAIHDQLRLRGVAAVRAQDDGAAEMTDEELLQRTTELGRIIFTQDIRFKALAEDWQRQGKTFSGLVRESAGSDGRHLREGPGVDREGV